MMAETEADAPHRTCKSGKASCCPAAAAAAAEAAAVSDAAMAAMSMVVFRPAPPEVTDAAVAAAAAAMRARPALRCQPRPAAASKGAARKYRSRGRTRKKGEIVMFYVSSEKSSNVVQ